MDSQSLSFTVQTTIIIAKNLVYYEVRADLRRLFQNFAFRISAEEETQY